MKFFQNSVLNKHLKAQDTHAIKAAYNEFVAYFHNLDIQQNIREAKEEQFQEGFLRELFVKVLGYTLNPSPTFNLTTEYKNVKDSKKADGAILINGVVKAVIELKGTETTDLNRIEAQAFGYKNNQPECVYVITSNFEKLRFYIDNAIENIEFNLFTLTEKEFELLWLCLAFVNIEKNLAKRIKDESVSQEDVITKNLYNDYSLFKRELHQNLVVFNPEHDPLTLFKKSQKLLDRFLFLFFAEDRQLLPPNSVRLILDDWRELQVRDVEIALYARFKKYFEYLNTGFKGKRYDVFAYNGGLFKTDELLDGLKIDDELLYRHAMKLSTYDFVSEVDVNILGHIFENSLNELDEIKAQLEGQQVDKAKSKRKKDGVFYTPKYITKYIVDNTVGKLCTEKKAEIGLIEEEYITDRKRTNKTKQPLFDKLNTYRNWLLQLTICDPACGSGAFLNQALDFLINEHRYIDELQAKLFGDAMVLSDFEKNILENNLFGVDLNEESVEIAKLSLWLRTAQPNRKLNDLNNNIKCGNSLIDDPAVAGDKAFKWQEEFTSVFAKGGFDVVIGNPPYVNIANIENVAIRKYYQTKFSTFKNKCDLYSLFIERSIVLTKRNGLLGFIFPNSWMGTSSFSRFREKISKDVRPEVLVELPADVFVDATVTTVIMTLRNLKNEFDKDVILYELKDQIFYKKDYSIKINEILSSESFTYSFQPRINLYNTKLKLGDVVEFSLGIKTSDDKRFIFDYKLDEISFPMLRGKDIGRYSKKFNGVYIWYNPDLIKQKEGGRPRVKAHFLKPKILIQDIAKKINCTYDDENFLVNDTINVIHEVKPPLTLYALIGILNSSLCSRWFNSNFPEGLHVKINQLQEIPLPEMTIDNIKDLSSKVALMLEKCSQFGLSEVIILDLLQNKYDIEKLTTKLQNWYELDAKEFLNELKKAKVQLSLSSEADWMQYFIQQKQIAQTLKSEIDKTDKEIDRMVYELYGLTEEEIGIVEGV